MADVRDAVAGPETLDGFVERLFGHTQQRRRLFRDLPDRQRHRAVAEIPAERCAHVNRDDVAVSEDAAPRRNAVDHLFVDRRADRRGIPVIPLERRDGACLRDALLGDRVEIRRAHARHHLRRQLREHVGDEPSGLVHPIELRR